VCGHFSRGAKNAAPQKIESPTSFQVAFEVLGRPEVGATLVFLHTRVLHKVGGDVGMFILPRHALHERELHLLEACSST
jgi:hypothetical protein